MNSSLSSCWRLMLVLSLLTAVGGVAQAQRLIPNQTGISARIGTTEPSDKNITERSAYSVNLDFHRYLKKYNYLFMGLEYYKNHYGYSVYKIPAEDYLLHLGYMHPLVTEPIKTFFVYGGVSASGGYEEINRGVKELGNGAVLEDRSRFVYGITALLSIEVFLTDNIVLLARGSGIFLWNTDLNLFRPSLSAGIKFNF